MKLSRIACITIAIGMALGTATVTLPQAKPGPGVPVKPIASPMAQAQAQFFEAGFDDLMTILIQPRHVKLYYAGSRRNWELAAAQVRDLRSAFGHVASSFPSYQGIGVDEALWSIMAPALQGMDAAIAAADPNRFEQAYRELTAACNACHAYMEHPYLVVKAPEGPSSSAFPDQEFSPAP